MPGRLSQFWQELKRRRVIQMITVYAGAAFVIIELINNVTEPLRLPEWTPTLVIILLLIGFPLAVIFSWIYDIQPKGGVVKTEPVDKVKSEDIFKSSSRWKIASYISFIVIVGLIILNVIPRTNHKRTPDVLDKSIAVLPFINDSPDKENTYFINGIQEAILDNLCKIEDLRVVSRTSVLKYIDDPKPIPQIAEEMQVGYILEGSGQKYANQIQLTIQLIDGKNDRHIWSQPFISFIEVTEIFNIQSQIAQEVADELRTIITTEEKDRIKKSPTTSLTAYDLFMKGREAFFDDRIDIAKSYYKMALDYDSTYAKAYSGLAWINLYKYGMDINSSSESLDSVLILTDIALTYDNQLSEAYLLRGSYYLWTGNPESAIRELDKAISYNPNYGTAYLVKGNVYMNYHLGQLEAIQNIYKATILERGQFLSDQLYLLGIGYLNVGIFKKGIQCFGEALALNRDSLEYFDIMGRTKRWQGDYREAIDYNQKGYLINTTHLGVLYGLGRCYMFLGLYKESREYFERWSKGHDNEDERNTLGVVDLAYLYKVDGDSSKAKSLTDKRLALLRKPGTQNESNPDEFNRYFFLSAIYALWGEKEKAVGNLEKFVQSEEISVWVIATLKNDPIFNSIKNEPEFQQIVRDAEAKYQAEHEKVRQWLEENDML